MKRSTLLFTAEEIRAALARQVNQYVLPGDYDRVARLYSEAGGALYIEAVMEKSGQSGNEGDVEQYDAVIPVPPVVIAAAATVS